MAIELAPIALPATASDTDFDPDFGREVKGVNPGELTPEQFKEVEIALYTVGLGSSPVKCTPLMHSAAWNPAVQRCHSYTGTTVCSNEGGRTR